MKQRRQRDRERGSAMLITVILISAILSGAAVLVSLQLGANRSTDLTRTGISALYCAEAGLTATRALIGQNADQWNTYLGQGIEPAFLSGISRSLDPNNPSSIDFAIFLEDNFDEIDGSDDPFDDKDSRIYVVARCLKYPDNPREIRELVGYQQQSYCYGSQQGGCGGNNNMNAMPL
jgi:hypothetical protein